MKPIIVTSAILLAFSTGQAMAVCQIDQRVNGANLSALLNNSLVCGRPGAGYTGSPNDRWQEEHIGGGVLFDFKLGVGHAVDPRKQVGTWSINNPEVTHNYSGGGSFTWTVHLQDNGSPPYSFCSGGTEVVKANITANSGSGCGGNFP
jgi:hypothetical protein